MDLLLSCLFGLIGSAYIVYGKKQSEMSFMLAGGFLLMFAYFVSGTIAVTGVGVLLVVAPFVAKHFGW